MNRTITFTLLLITVMMALTGAACAQSEPETPTQTTPAQTATAEPEPTVATAATTPEPTEIMPPASTEEAVAPQPTEAQEYSTTEPTATEDPEPTRESAPPATGIPEPTPTFTLETKKYPYSDHVEFTPAGAISEDSEYGHSGYSEATPSSGVAASAPGHHPIPPYTGPSHPWPPHPGPPGPGRRQPTVPSAGEIDDNDQWNKYLEFISGYYGPEVWETPVRERYIVTVQDENGRPVRNATVTFTSDQDELQVSRTYADGRTIFHHPGPEGEGQISVSATHGGKSDTGEIERSPDGGKTKLVIPQDEYRQGRTELDALFLLDSTGSMADEIDRIKTTLTSIARQVEDLPSNPDLRMGMAAYRDRGDEYVTRLYDFDGDPERFARTVRNVRAAGGQDYPESLNEALHIAINKPSWRENSVKLIFLVADAPPHLDYEQDFRYDTEMAKAREDGKKIFAVASSGLEEQGEYIFRQLAQQTMGKFIFMLYESGVQRELTTPHDVGDDFTVENLDRLIVRLISKELQQAGTQE